MKICSIIVGAVLAASSLAHGQAITDSFTYQGTLQDNGVPANAFYDIVFIVYDAPVGGLPIALTTVLNVEAADGLLEAFVDFGTSGVVFDSDQTRWVELQVAPAGALTFTTLAPRQRVTPAPVSNYALRSGSSLQDAFNNGTDIYANNENGGLIDIFSNDVWGGAIRINNVFGNPRAIFFQNGFGAGDVTLYGNGDQIVSRLYNDTSAGGGGFLRIARNDTGDTGITLEGNRLGSESAGVSIFGTDRSIVLDTDASGDDSVLFPSAAINAVEILNEVGVAETVSPGLVGLTDDPATIDIINSITLNCPTDGYALVIATAEVTISHVGGTTSSANFGVSAISTNLPSNGDIEVRIDASVASGGLDYPVTVHAIFPVNGGSNTFFFLGDKNAGGGTISAIDRQLTAVFIPTAYGTVARQGDINLPDELAPITGPMTHQDIAAEREAALRVDLDRQQREIDTMKVQMQQLIGQAQNDSD